jgi:hypothetical protein
VAAELLQLLLRAGEVLDQVDLAIGDDDVGATGEDRLHQVADALLRVLVVAVGVHDDVGAQLQRPLHAVVEGAAQTPVPRVPHEVRDAVLLRDLDRAIRRAVVDDHDDDLVDPVDLLRDRREDRGQGLLLVQTGDLDHEAHGRRLPRADGETGTAHEGSSGRGTAAGEIRRGGPGTCTHRGSAVGSR